MGIAATLAVVYAISCCGVIGFQIALIAGAPWGPITQGGTHERALPLSGRVAACASIFILLGLACAIRSAAGLWPFWPGWTAWIALAVQALSTLANWITPSKPERRLWAPITSFLLATALGAILLA